MGGAIFSQFFLLTLYMQQVLHYSALKTGVTFLATAVTAILAAGIAVTSTVNIQHLESLNDDVFELTGVRVRETFPDRILDEADEVVLVDLAPEALQELALVGLPARGGLGRDPAVRRADPHVCLTRRAAAPPR